ncbi:MAG: hypothetical protein ACPGSM_03950 [Thiolinea sp.]
MSNSDQQKTDQQSSDAQGQSAEQNRPDQSIALTLRYQQPSEFYQDHLQLFSHLNREAVSFNAKVKQPIAFREAMATLFAVVSSDYRYVPKDRTAYTAFMRMRRNSEHQGLMKAQCAYFDWLLKNDPQAWLILDPVINVQQDQVSFEVFSKDEGSYAMLSFDHSFFDIDGEVQCGTTNIDYSDALAQGIEQIRSQRDTRFSIGQETVKLQTETAPDLSDTEVLEKKINVPTSWLRGFLQVQSSAQLPATRFTLQPIDLYNTLHHLRMHADIKGKRRGLRIELVPGEQPLLVLEPNDTVITGSAEAYQGKQAQIVRLWGRRRLALLKRFLPYTERIDVALLGNGMPGFWILRGQGVCLTLAITGFTASNWSQALNFDLLLPRKSDNPETLTTVVNHLQQAQQATLAQISKATQLSRNDCNTALQQACQQGLVMFDLASTHYRYRPLTQEPLDMALFQFRQPAEKLAFDLVERQQAISSPETRIIHGEGVEISAEIKVKEDRRTYLSRLRLNEEGHVAKAECSCHQIMKHGLSHGPCSHLIALRLAYAGQQAGRKASQITQETRTYSRRRREREEQYRLTLNHQRLVMEWEKAQRPRQQQFAFNSIAEARSAYLDKIQQLENSGFMDITAG